MNATNKILLRRKNLLIVEPINADYEQTKNEQALVVTMMKNVLFLTWYSAQLQGAWNGVTQRCSQSMCQWPWDSFLHLPGSSLSYVV